MSGKRKRRPLPEKRRLVLVFGEDDHDRRAIGHLTEGLRPDLVGAVEARRKPLVLIKGATKAKARSNAESIAQLVRQEAAARDIVAVLAHQDCDAIEPAHEHAARRIEEELHHAGCPGTPIGVTPCWEIEAWWMLFPEAVAKVVQQWREPKDWIGRDVGKVEHAKEKLARAVRPRRATKSSLRGYQERDSIEIAKNVASDDLLASFRNGVRESHPNKSGRVRCTRSASFEAFRVKVLGIGCPDASDTARTSRS